MMSCPRRPSDLTIPRYNNYAKLGLGELGYKTKFKGLGVFFVKDDQGQALIQVKYGNGETSAAGITSYF